MQLSLLSVLALASTALAAVAPRDGAHAASEKRDLTERRLDTRATVKCTVNTQFLKNGKCVACTTLDKDASKCSTAGKITACKTKMFYSGKCYAAASCPSGTYANTSKKICSTCTFLFPNSSKCTSKAASACKSGYFLNDGACVKTCPSGEYGSSGKCLSCFDKFPGSSTCTVDKATKCASSFFLSGSNCVDTCPSGQYGSSGKCSPCSSKFPGSATCTVYKALTCSSDYFLQSGKCTKTCATGTYGIAGACASCATAFSGSVTCDASGPKTCKSPLALFNATCETLLTSCDDGKFVNATTNRCDECSEAFEYVFQCKSTAPLTCLDGFTLKDNACIKKVVCQDDQFSNPEGTACVDCTSVFENVSTCNATVALSCLDGFNLTAGKCIKNTPACAEDEYYSKEAAKCITCVVGYSIGTATCAPNYEGGALTCKEGYVMYTNSRGGACAKDCGSDASIYGDRYSNTCKACTSKDAHATTCTPGTGDPTACATGYTLVTTVDSSYVWIRCVANAS